MANLIAVGEAAQRRWRSKHLVDDAVYVRGAAAPLRVQVTQGSTRVTMISRDGAMSTQGRISDFLIDVVFLVAYGEPQVGDIIQHGGKTYAVCHGVDDTRAWVWSGRDCLTYRIHCVLVADVAVVTTAISSRAELIAETLHFGSASIVEVPFTMVDVRWTLTFIDVGFPNNGRVIVVRADNNSSPVEVVSDTGGNPIARASTAQLVGTAADWSITAGQLNDIVLTSGGEIVIDLSVTDSNGTTALVTI